MEERGRFELPEPAKVLLISSQVQSATLPPFRADTVILRAVERSLPD